MKQQITKAVLAKRLSRCLQSEVSEAQLDILLFGWTAPDPKLRNALNHRNWLFDYEVQAFSDYAGYNLLLEG